MNKAHLVRNHCIETGSSKVSKQNYEFEFHIFLVS